MNSEIRSTAIIGSGIAGLTLGNLLGRSGVAVTLFEKARGPGGRTASKRFSDSTVDMGAQYFTVRNERFRGFLEAFAGDCVQPWQGRLVHQREDGDFEPYRETTRWVGVPRMSALARALGTSLDIRYATPVRTARRADGAWYLETDSIVYGPYDTLAVTVPPEQAVQLLPGVETGACAFRMEPCWAVAVRFDASPEPGFDGAGLREPALGWVARNSSKPGRSGDRLSDWWLLHATPEWSRQQLDTAPDEVARMLVERFQTLLDSRARPLEWRAHRWRFARPHPDAGSPGCLSHPEQGLALCGDWLAGGRVEGAFLSAEALIARWRELGLIS